MMRVIPLKSAVRMVLAQSFREHPGGSKAENGVEPSYLRRKLEAL